MVVCAKENRPSSLSWTTSARDADFHPLAAALTVTVCAPSRAVSSTGVTLKATEVTPTGMVTVAGKLNSVPGVALSATVRAVVAA